MIGWLLDTNVLSSLINPQGAPSVKNWAATQAPATFCISILSIGEIEKGIHNLPESHPKRGEFEAARDRLLLAFANRLLPLGNEVVRLWGEISGRILRETGHSPSVTDTLIAATALHHDLHLVTRNVRDVSRSGAIVFNPWQDHVTEFPLASRK